MKSFKTEEELARRARGRIRRAIRALEVQKVHTRSEVRAYGCVPDFVLYRRVGSAIVYVVMIEFKLRDWRRALGQAFRYRNIGNEAYVVVDRAQCEAAVTNVETFRKANVGLLTVDENGVLEAWHYPSPSLPFSDNWAKSLVRSILGPKRRMPKQLPFLQSLRGGRALAGLRRQLGPVSSI